MKIEDKNIVLVVLDTVSAKHLPMYGYDRNTTPFLSQLAKENTLFKNAFSDAAWTAPSHTSIFTGKSTAEHITGTKNLTMIGDSFVEKLNENGYHTAGFSHNNIVSKELQFDKGFDKFNYDRDKIIMEENGFADLHSLIKDFETDKEGFRKYLEVLKHVLSESDYSAAFQGAKYVLEKNLKGFDISDQIVESSLDTIKDEEKFFLFANFNHAHRPYLPKSVSEWLEDTEEAKKIHREIYQSQENFWYKELSEENKYYFRALYDTCIKELDQKIKKLYNEVKQQDEDTVFILTADHGENIGENDMRGHQCGLWEKLVHVPLIIAGEKVPEQIVEEQAAIKNIGKFIETGNFEDIKQEEIKGRYEGQIHLREKKPQDLQEEEIKYIENTSKMKLNKLEGEIKHSNLENEDFTGGK